MSSVIKNLEEKGKKMNKKDRLNEEEINCLYKKAVKDLKKHPKRFIDTELVKKVNNKLIAEKVECINLK